MRILISILIFSSRPKIEILTYGEILETKELINWITASNKYFDYEEVRKDKKVKYVITMLRSHSPLWLDGVHE